MILSFFTKGNAFLAKIATRMLHKDKTEAAQAKTDMIIDELNRVSWILSVRLDQLSKVVVQPFHPEGSVRRLLAKRREELCGWGWI